MPEQESLLEKSTAILKSVEDVEKLLKNTMDVGESTYFQEEKNQIVNDLHNQLDMLRSRIRRLKRRFVEKNNIKK
jgi:hypothetical protein